MIEGFGKGLRLGVLGVSCAAVFCARFPRKAFIYLSLHKKARQMLEWGTLLLLVLGVFYTFVLAAPADFPERALVPVKKGETLEAVASDLKNRGIVSSAMLLELSVRVMRGDGAVVAGEYAFVNPQNLMTVARRLTAGDFELEPVRVRVAEGMSAAQISSLLSRSLFDFDQAAFDALAEPEEGKLFPDTYFFLPGEDPELIVSAMTDNFNAHIHEINVATAIASFGKPLGDVLTMASILEREAATAQDRRIIAGILWHRIDVGMRLQVDAAPDTYKTAGLPAAPIDNPSVDAILAAVTPVTTSYVYYLSDKNGVTHYSTTFTQHVDKIQQYLSD